MSERHKDWSQSLFFPCLLYGFNSYVLNSFLSPNAVEKLRRREKQQSVIGSANDNCWYYLQRHLPTGSATRVLSDLYIPGAPDTPRPLGHHTYWWPRGPYTVCCDPQPRHQQCRVLHPGLWRHPTDSGVRPGTGMVGNGIKFMVYIAHAGRRCS